MDEPLSNLDAKLRVKMRTELKAIHAQTQATTVFVTHDQAEAMSMADRIVVMKDGAIVQCGTADDVYFDCEDMFVAGFIGTPPTNLHQHGYVFFKWFADVKEQHPLNTSRQIRIRKF